MYKEEMETMKCSLFMHQKKKKKSQLKFLL